MQKRDNIFISTIKENYTFLLLLVFLTIVISIQGCQPSSPTLSIGNCCKIKNPALVTQACIATSLTNAECASIAAQTGSSYELAPASSCLNFARNPDCGTDEFNNKIGCYLNDGSGVNRFIPQANPPESPQPSSKFCQYGTSNLYKCDQGQAVLTQTCSGSTSYCISGACSACTPAPCVSGQTVTNCNTICPTTCGEERQITNITADQFNPRIYGNKIVWEENRNGNWDIYMYNLATSTETRITTNTGDQRSTKIYNDKIVYRDLRNGNYDIYMYNLATSTETRITTNTAEQNYPAIYGDKIVWYDRRNGNYDIYMYNLATSTETRITTNTAIQIYPRIYGDKIVYQDYRNGNYDIYMYNLTTSTETRITTNTAEQYAAEIYNDKIVYKDYRNGNYDIYMYNLATSTETRITYNTFDDDLPVIYNNIIVWYKGPVVGSHDIYMTDLSLC